MSKIRPLALYLVAALSGLVSAFFVFYSVRLFYVTQGLTAINTAGQGAYIGAVAFPLIALGFGWLTWRCLKSARRHS